MPENDRRAFLKGIGTLTAAGSVGFAGCTGGGDGQGGSGIDNIRIACPTSLSGPFAPYGEAERDGGKLAAQHLEEEFDIGVEVIDADTEVDPSRAVEQFERLVVEEDADFGYGGVSSAVGIAMGSWANDNQVPFLAHGTSDDITGAECAQFMFSTYMSNSMQAPPAAPQMAEQADTWYVLYSDYTWGHTANEAYSKLLPENGAEIVGREAVPFPADDYTPYLNGAEASDADGLALLVAGLDQRLSTSQILDTGLHEEFTIQMHQNEDVGLWGLNKEAGSILDINTQGWSPGIEAGEDWKDEVIEVSDHDPFVRHYIGYTSVDQLVRAAVRAESTEGSAIVDELEGHQVESEQVLELQPAADRIYWREADHQLMQPTYVTSGMAVEDMQDDPYKVWFEVTDTMSAEEASPSPNPECEL